MDLPWRVMWSAGWAAAWPPEVRECWWTIASGTRYFAGARRAYDRVNAGCKMCEAAYGAGGALDTLDHMTVCPTYAPLWASIVVVLGLVGTRIPATIVLRFVVYGAARAATTLIRGAALEAVRCARNRSLSAAANGGLVYVDPFTVVRSFRDELRRHMQLDYCVATGVHQQPPTPRVGSNLHMPLRPLSRGAFAAKWHGVLQLRRAGRVRHYSYQTTFEHALDLPDDDV